MINHSEHIVPAINDSLTSIVVSIVALLIAIIALVYTIKTYLLKSGVRVRGYFSTCSSIDCEDIYVSDIVIENMKDRAIVIFKIFLEIDNGYFIELENFEDSPLILKPFEAYKKQFDPIIFYAVGMKQISLNKLFNDRKVRKRLILKTTDGKSVVTHPKNHWDPIVDYFKNYGTALIHPFRVTYKEKAYGSNVRFLVELKYENNKEQVIPIRPGDDQFKLFRNFYLTRESLESKDKLEAYLIQMMVEEKLLCSDLVVYDTSIWKQADFQISVDGKIIASRRNYFVYRYIYRVATIISDFKLRQKNKRLQKEAKKPRAQA